MAQKDLLVGIDIGGTTVKAALVTMEGEIITQAAVRTGTMTTDEELERLARSILSVAGDDAERVADVGLAIPGVVSPDDRLLQAPNITLDLPGLIEELRKVFPGAGVWPINDANAAALGELWQGAGAGNSSMVFVTLGTGVGAGVVVDGRIVEIDVTGDPEEIERIDVVLVHD